ncbi:MAG: Maf family protein, partial [Oscillospiraceae bacterium]|nr:Maf family protein [Oscillospiraceae bacterium]
TFTEVTDLHFRPLREGEIARYVASGEPMDKAGAYGIQGLASIFVDRLDGDYYNVMGFPLCTLAELLKRFGINVL